MSGIYEGRLFSEKFRKLVKIVENVVDRFLVFSIEE